MPEVVRKLGVTEQTYYRWKREYRGLRTDQAKRLKNLKKENALLKQRLADAELDKAMLREAASGNFYLSVEKALRCLFPLERLPQTPRVFGVADRRIQAAADFINSLLSQAKRRPAIEHVRHMLTAMR